MDINCPYCGTHYELDELLIPDGDIKVKCRVCSNIFIINKKTGVFKDNIGTNSATEEKKNETTTGIDTKNTDKNHLNDIPEDVMKSIISEINNAVTEESYKNDKVKDLDSSKSKPKKTKKGASPFQISMVILLGIVFLIAVFSFLVHYGVISSSYLPPTVSEILLSF